MASARNRVSIMHGVNLDSLGRRDPEVYGSFTLSELEHKIEGWAHDLGLETAFMQTNEERELVEHLQRLGDLADGGILNAGAWTHYAYSLRDALEVSTVPIVEVHISDIHAREDWRQISVFEGVAIEQIAGEGPEGYRRALERLAGQLGVSP